MGRDCITTHPGLGSPQGYENKGQESLVPSSSNLAVAGGACWLVLFSHPSPHSTATLHTTTLRPHRDLLCSCCRERKKEWG